MATLTIGMSEAKAHFSRLTAEVNRTGTPVTVFKNNRPWVVINPALERDDFATMSKETIEAIEDVEARRNLSGPYQSLDEMWASIFNDE